MIRRIKQLAVAAAILVAPVVTRFIPTCVGSIRRCPPWAQPEAVHPHVRGEHNRILVGFRFGSGSSPRAWGA